MGPPLLSATASLIILMALASSSHAIMPICNAYRGATYEAAKRDFQELRQALEVVEQQGVVAWYTDNANAAERASTLATLATCGNDTKIPVVVYGIPNKDCEAGYSNAGTNKNFDDYKAFIGALTTAFPSQHMVYIIEPDAVGLTANGGCGIEKEYPKYLMYVLGELSKNPNAELFLDIGYWLLLPTGKLEALTIIMDAIWPAGSRVKGIALNTANYRTTEEMVELCDSFAKVIGKPDMKCIIDTSRNNKGPSPKSEWCNTKNTGIGVPPTMDTGISRAAYFLWVKPPGESDGTCASQTSGESMPGPAAGMFFKDHFEMLWKNGYFAANTNSSSGSGSDAPATISWPSTVAPRVPTPRPSHHKCKLTHHAAT